MQLGVPGPWFERLPHFKLEFTPAAGDELQSEYFVARADAVAAIAAVRRCWRGRSSRVLQVSEVRSIAGDDLWLSPATGRTRSALHFTWKPGTPRPRCRWSPRSRPRSSLSTARPHWGKVFRTAPETVRGLYPRLADAVRLAARFDPDGVFGNRFVEEYLGV